MPPGSSPPSASPGRSGLREGAILVGALLVPAVIALFGARSFGRPSMAIVAGALSAGGAAGRLAFDSVVQRDAPEAARGRTFARFETRFQLAWVAGAFAPVVVPGGLPGRPGFLLLAVGLGFAGLSYLGTIRAAR